jgi:hypothetical protein
MLSALLYERSKSGREIEEKIKRISKDALEGTHNLILT